MKQHVVRTIWIVSVVAAVVGLCVSSARADINWITQPSLSPVTFSGVMGQAQYNYTNGDTITDANGNTIYNDLYNGVPQTDAGTSYNGFNNSMVTSASGTLTTTGNNFLSSLNFGNEPLTTAGYDNFAPTTQFGLNGNWLPNSNNGGLFIGSYTPASPAQAAFTMVGATGTNQLGQPYSPVPGGGPLDPGGGPNGTGTAGRVSFLGTAGIANSRGNAATVTSGTYGAMNVPAQVFDGSIIHFTGVLGANINYMGDLDQAGGDELKVALNPSTFYTVAGGLGDISNNLSGAAAQGYLVRGGIANTPGASLPASDYVMAVPYQADLSLATNNSDQNALNIGTATAFDFKFTTTFVAVANLAKGDVNFDGVVNGLDIAAVSSNWLQSNIQHIGTGDANGDGVVNGLDIALIASNWLATTPVLGGGGGGSGSAVPEPGTLALMGLGAVGVLAMRRRMRQDK